MEKIETNPQSSPKRALPQKWLSPLIVLIIIAGGILWWFLTKEPGIPPQAQLGDLQLQGVVTSVDKASQKFVLETARLEQKDGKFQRVGGTFTIIWSNKTRFLQDGDSVDESLLTAQQPVVVTLFRPESRENRQGATAKEILFLPK